MTSKKLFSNYSELSEENIKRNHCSVYSYNIPFHPYREERNQINFDDFMESIDTPLYINYESCLCLAPVDPSNSNEIFPDMRVFLRACKKSDIEKSKCLEMFDFDKITNIDKLNAKKLSLLGSERCREYNERNHIIRLQMEKSKQNKRCKEIASRIDE
jgi:hypothetical protein